MASAFSYVDHKQVGLPVRFSIRGVGELLHTRERHDAGSELCPGTWSHHRAPRDK
jgi:hypothetical protein